MSNYRILSLADSAEWSGYLKQLPIEQQDVYFTPEYYSLYEANGDGEARCFVFERGGDLALFPFLINRISALGYDLEGEYYDIQGAYGYNGVVSSSYGKEFKKLFHESFSNYASENNIVCQFLRFHPLLKNEEFHRGFGEVLFDRRTVAIRTDDPDLEQDFDRQVMKKMRRSVREGVNIRNAESEDDFNSFNRIYSETMDFLDADDFYYFSDEYFSKMKELSGDIFRLIVAEQAGVVIGGMWMMNWGIYAHNHLSAADIASRNTGVNVAVQYGVIMDAVEHGRKFLHLGGGRAQEEDDSLLRFKQNFSKSTHEFYIGKVVNNPYVYASIVKQWKEKHPDSFAKYSGRVQGYRMVDLLQP